jgi:hypothetical protein
VSTHDDEPTSAAVSFSSDILPMFTEMDIDHMKRFRVLLDDYSYMSDSTKAHAVYETVSAGSMPPSRSGEPPWSPSKVALFQQWMEGGYQP